QDTFLLYFSGHGVRNLQVNRAPYWVTYRTSLDVLDDEGIRLTYLLDYIRDIKAKRKIILLDHCFSGDLVTSSSMLATNAPTSNTPSSDTGASSLLSRDAGAPLALQKDAFPHSDFESIAKELTAGGSGTVILTAARNEAFELDTLKHGIFTSAILE